MSKRFIRPPLLHIKSNPDVLGLLSPTYGQHSKKSNRQITLQSILINKSNVFQGHMSCRDRENSSTEVHGCEGLESANLEREPVSSHPVPVHP